MKLFMRDWVEREYSLDEARITLSCGCKVASLKASRPAKWIEHGENGIEIHRGVVCEVCYITWGCIDAD